jgi:hypothetical protein
MYASFRSYHEQSASFENDRLYTAKRYLLSLGAAPRSAATDREQDATFAVAALAVAGVAAELSDGGAFERPRDQGGPHSAVERG